MAYDPADLQLPGWLLRLLDALIRIRLPIARHWSVGMTRAGSILIFSLLGIWAAALYSGNNLLYLCGGMLTAIALFAFAQGIQLLRNVPSMGRFIPEYCETETPIVVRQPVPFAKPVPALVHAVWPQMKAVWNIRISASCATFHGHIRSDRRLNLQMQRQHLSTSAPLGLWQLECQRHDPAHWITLPKPIPWIAGQASSETARLYRIEGDEYHDLRPYTPGDALTRIHWRKSTLDPGDWRIKRFAQADTSTCSTDLRVDLRIPNNMHASHMAFERLLGMAWHWLKALPNGNDAELIFGQQRFACHASHERLRAIQAIAAAQPEQAPPLNGAGILLSLVES